MANNTVDALYNEISRDFKTNNRTRRTDLPEFMELKASYKENKVYFSIGWYDTFIISFNPKTVGVKYTKTNKLTRESQTISKQFPLNQDDLLETILNLYKA